ncbi:MAG: cytochrome bd-I oxidase subunit CydX [Pelistega sp.]|nr:cytochrome bd-I oxidase subunit CydX [Pelistega sp.]
MWYLTWLLGTSMACGVAVAVGLWYELHQQKLDASNTETAELGIVSLGSVEIHQASQAKREREV